MFEKVNPSHPDKLADRIAGAIVDLAYREEKNPKVAVEVLLGHGACHIIIETNTSYSYSDIDEAVWRITQDRSIKVDIKGYYQDTHLSENQKESIHCGDNGIFKGVPVTKEQQFLSRAAQDIYARFPTDGKYIVNNLKDIIVICQSCAPISALREMYPNAVINPIGDWSGGINVDTGATNRKLGSDMGDSITGGGLWGKDLSKADVSINIYCWLKSQETHQIVTAFCAIGDTDITLTFDDGTGALYDEVMAYSDIVETVRGYINSMGGFEKLAEWGLLR